MTRSDADIAEVPEELPPVQPPSAGFIIQLFVVPGLIVAGIFGIWFLLGRMVSGDQDWQSQIIELQHPNRHRRWRGALGLAQMLSADQKRGAAGQRLADNRDMAQALANMLRDGLNEGGQTAEELNHQAYVARALGMFNLPEVVFPALQAAMQPGHDREVRKNAITAVADMLDRMAPAADDRAFEPAARELLQVSQDDDPLIRQLTAYTLGLFPQRQAAQRLHVMCNDTDADTRINAAIGLARQHDPAGLPVLEEVLGRAAHPADPGSPEEFEQFVAIDNSLKAIERIAPQIAPEDRARLQLLLEPIAHDYREPRIRIAAQTSLAALAD